MAYTYDHTYIHYFISFIRSIDQRRVLLFRFETDRASKKNISEKYNSFALLRYTCFALTAILLDTFVC